MASLHAERFDKKVVAELFDFVFMDSKTL